MQAEQLIWLIGPFPPPLHGQAVYNAAFADHLRRRGRLRVLVTGGSILSKFLGYGRIMLAGAFRISRNDMVYTSMPGQKAAWVFALLAMTFRLRGIRHFVHHHSYRAIALGPIGVMRLIVRLGGKTQHHILLSPHMRDRFVALYLQGGGATRAHTLSNSLLFCPSNATVKPRPARPFTIGHLSVLTVQKGVDTVIRIYRQAVLTCPDLRMIIAGPIGDERLKDLIAAAVTEFSGRVDYRGPVSGPTKSAFYDDIDLFLLPSRLIDEAEPLVMLESYSAGVEFMGNNQGCISERIRYDDRLLTSDDRTDVARVIAVLQECAVDWESSRDACGKHAVYLHRQAVTEAHALFKVMVAA